MSESQDMILYYTPVSSYSQKVEMALNYLNIKFEKRIVKLFEGEQLETWYLDINPKGEVPTIKDGDVVLADSIDILQYLNDTYDTRRSDEKLIPNPVTPLGRSVLEVNQSICSIQTALLTFGSAFHPQHTKNGSLSDGEREARKQFIDKVLAQLQEKMKTAQSPYKESYTYKLTKLATGKAMFSDEKKFLDEIKNARGVLEQIECLLARAKSKYLFSDYFTVADISLVVILNRIEKLGLQHHFFDGGLLPKLKAYLDRVKSEPFVQKVLC